MKSRSDKKTLEGFTPGGLVDEIYLTGVGYARTLVKIALYEIRKESKIADKELIDKIDAKIDEKLNT